MAKKRTDWVPRPQAQFHLWQGNLITVLFDLINAPIFNIPAGKETALLALQSTYETKYQAAPPFGDATKSGRRARDDARKAYISGAGGLRKIVAQYVRYNEEVSDELKMELGVKVASHTHTANTQRAEVDFPHVQVKSNSPGTVTFIFHQMGSPKGSGKEEGMHHCLVEYMIGTTEPNSPDDCTKHLEMQKSPHTEPLGMKYTRQSIYGFPCWVDTRGKKRNYGPMFTCVIT